MKWEGMALYWIVWIICVFTTFLIPEAYALLTHRTPLTDVLLFLMDEHWWFRFGFYFLFGWLILLHLVEPRIRGKLGQDMKRTRIDDLVVGLIMGLISLGLGKTNLRRGK